MGWFDLITGGLGQTDPHQEIDDWADAQQARNRQALGLDANGNPLPQATDAQGNPIVSAAGAQPPNGQAVAAGQAAASGVMQPQQEPAATKMPPSLGHILMDLQRYQRKRTRL
jgi:hypothetical protein